MKIKMSNTLAEFMKGLKLVFQETCGKSWEAGLELMNFLPLPGGDYSSVNCADIQEAFCEKYHISKSTFEYAFAGILVEHKVKYAEELLHYAGFHSIE